MVKLRFKRFGRRNRPCFRLNAIDTRRPRNGLPVEELGVYDPRAKDVTKRFAMKTDRVQHWLDVGAQPSDTVRSLLRKAGLTLPDIRQKRTTQAAPKAPKAAPVAKGPPTLPTSAPAAAPAPAPAAAAPASGGEKPAEEKKA